LGFFHYGLHLDIYVFFYCYYYNKDG
jgi:hypothetical protein